MITSILIILPSAKMISYTALPSFDRQLASSPYSEDDQDTQEDRCACDRTDLGLGTGPDNFLDTVKVR